MFSQQRFHSFKKLSISIVTYVLICLVFTTLITLAVGRSIDVIVQNYGKITLVRLDAYGGDITPANGAFSVDWGQIYVGSSKNVSFYLRSVSNVPVTLAFSLFDWKPESIEAFILVSWNYSGSQVAPGEEIPIRIDLNTVTSSDFIDYLIVNNITSFSFSLSIYAVES